MLHNYVFWITIFLVLAGAYIIISHHLLELKNDDNIDDISNNDVEIEYVDDFPEDIVNIPGYDYFYYSIKTKKVYHVFVKGDIEYLDIFTINNHFCKYINGKVVETVDDKIVAIVHTSVLQNKIEKS